MVNETTRKTIATLLSPCTEWQGGHMSSGYGYLRVEGKLRYAHRVAYCEHHGLSLSDIAGQVVRHRCDNPPCVNPEHLELGSQADNVQDAVDRGRAAGAMGEDHGHAKLTVEEVLAIRAEHTPHCRETGGAALARKYGVSQAQISGIVNRRYWSHV